MNGTKLVDAMLADESASGHALGSTELSKDEYRFLMRVLKAMREPAWKSDPGRVAAMRALAG